MNELELMETINMMQSEDYQERFKAEYHQTKIRYEKLVNMLIKHEAGTLEFNPACPIEILEDQKYYMDCYLHVLRVRAELEGIEL